MEIIRAEQKEYWNGIVKSFDTWDIYYLNEYARSLAVHGDGMPLLIYFASDGARMAYVVMQNDIAEFEAFRNILDRGVYVDWTTPYGYGGPLYDGALTEEWVGKCIKQLNDYARENHVISQFFRYHPLLQNQIPMERVSRVLYVKKTVYMDTSSRDIIYNNMTPNNRNMVRKAQRNGISILVDTGERIDEFEQVYRRTMEMHDADDYYYFESRYFEYIRKEMRENVRFFYALYEGRVISSSIFFYNDKYMHYHLSGTLPEYRNLAAANLLLTEAAFWASDHGIQKFHLGGGIVEEDSLLRFKKNFNRYGSIDFCIGSYIFDEQAFARLVELRRSTDSDFDIEKPFMIKYRA